MCGKGVENGLNFEQITYFLSIGLFWAKFGYVSRIPVVLF